MGDCVIPLRDIKPQMRKWTIKIQVMEKSYPRTSQNSSRFFQRLTLGDCEGTRIQATIFGSDVKLFENTLKINQKYLISNATVRHILPDYRIVDNNFQLYINGSTLVEEITDSTNDLTNSDFTPFTELQSYVGPDSSVDIVAAALQIYPSRQITLPTGEATLQEVMLVTEDMTPVMLTMWDQFINNECKTIADTITTWPVIVAKRLKVNDYHGPALSTRSKSCVMINPGIIEAEMLHDWCKEHKQQVEALILATPHETIRTHKNAPTPSDIITAEAATKLQTMAPFWLKATAFISNFTQQFWYTSCNQCNKAIHTDCGKTYTCIYCKKTATAQPRSRFEVQLVDKSGHITAKCLGHHADRIFPFTATELKDHSDEDGNTEREFLEKHRATGSHFFLLKPFNLTTASGTKRQLTIISIQEEKATASTTSP